MEPAFTVAPYGKGQVYFLGFPLEMTLTTTPGAFHTPEAQPFWMIYHHIAWPFMQTRAVVKQHPQLGVTEHPLDARSRVVVVINYSPEPIETTLDLASGWKLGPAWYGATALSYDSAQAARVAVTLPHNNALVITVEKQN